VFGILIGGSSFQAYVNGGFTSASAVTYLNGWHQYAFSWIKSTQFLLYFDGIQVASGTAYAASLGTAAPICLGNRVAGSREWLGYADDLAVWNRALSAAEIWAWYEDAQSGYRRSLSTAGWNRRPDQQSPLSLP
jgi:hypothetical protein